ncbi:unnamed protein product [Notodromas monacha]|uniref:Calponin-homology (CH) domain-containing protein n=1 Tax=Notodromas monacha TaxID=399045 RepID=A0A7R9BVN1_9CRUS|nr:unnamed protein product [Notodromas monacha]CAG0920961.1 unnamed protein product [Notodromas monacha]
MATPNRPKSPRPGTPKSDREESFWEKIGTLGRKKSKGKDPHEIEEEGKYALDSAATPVGRDWSPEDYELDENEERSMIEPHSRDDHRLKELCDVLIEWINDELAPHRIIVQDVEEDLYDGQVFQKLLEKLSNVKLDCPEVTQSEEGQKHKLRVILSAANKILGMPRGANHKWSVERIHSKNLVSILHLLVALVRHFRAPVKLPENVVVNILVVRKKDGILVHEIIAEEITARYDDLGMRGERDAFDTLFDHAPDKLVVVKKSLIAFVNKHLNRIDMELTDLEGQLSDGVFLVLLMGLLENYFIPLFAFNISPQTFDQKVHNVAFAFELMQDAGLPKPKSRPEDIVNGDVKSTLRVVYNLFSKYKGSECVWCFFASASCFPNPSPFVMRSLIDVLCALIVLAVTDIVAVDVRPHIIVILADDLGFNDLSFRGGSQIPTPNIDSLAYSGIILNNYYVQPMCTPSRAALLTGKYPVHTGMQSYVIVNGEPWGLGLEEKVLPEYLRDLGYQTRAVGKWHLGFHCPEHTPTHRGFESHFGYWGSHEDYYNHSAPDKDYPVGYDLRRNMDDVSRHHLGEYATDLFTQEAVDVILSHDKATPLFLYLAHLAPHAGSPESLQAPEDLVGKFDFIKDEKRKKYAAMLTKLDQSIGLTIQALEEAKMLENSVILFSTDNGGTRSVNEGSAGSNFPLRAEKGTVFEGGTRANGILWSPMLKKKNRVSNQLLHITDWLPTLFSVAGGQDESLPVDIDGVNQWSALSENEPSARSTMVYNIANDTSSLNGVYGSVRIGDYKLVKGSVNFSEPLDGWYGDPNVAELTTQADKDLYNATVDYLNTWNLVGPIMDALNLLPNASIQAVMKNASVVKCRLPIADVIVCDPEVEPCVFHIENDPCEQVNLLSSVVKPSSDVFLNNKVRECSIGRDSIFDELFGFYDEVLAASGKRRNKEYDPGSSPRGSRGRELIEVAEDDPSSSGTTPSKSQAVMTAIPQLPSWLWKGVAACLGIRLKPDQKPILATILYMLGLSSGLCYIAANFWFSIFNTASQKTKDDVVDGFVSVLVSMSWVALGLYARRLAHKLLNSKLIVPLIRLHARTVFRLNAALVLAALLLAFLSLSILSAAGVWQDVTCQTVDVTVALCKIRFLSRLIFSMLFFLWNLLVGVVMISLCRTHTLNIRAAIVMLDADSATELEGETEARPIGKCGRESFLRLDEEWSSDEEKEQQPPPSRAVNQSKLTTEEILNEFWKVSRELHVSSLMFQQWLMSVIGLTICWTGIHLVYWLRHSPSVYQLGELFIPVLLLPLLTSNYAQVNTEACRMIRSIRPTRERLNILLHLNYAPPQMTIYGHCLSYGTIVTAISALLLAFFSKILLSEIAAAI